VAVHYNCQPDVHYEHLDLIAALRPVHNASRSEVLDFCIFLQYEMPGVTESLGRSLKQAHKRQIRRDGFAHSLHTHIATLLNESSVSATLEALFALRDNSLLPAHARGHDRVKAARPDFQFDIV